MSQIIFAPAKINLFLHITGKRDDGYHALQSLIAFCDIGDGVLLNPSDKTMLTISGPYADKLSGQDNIIVKVLKRLSELKGQALNFDVRLTKNLPVAAGIGGGSSNAAAVLRAVLDAEEPEGLQDLMLDLGADVPVCFYNQTAFVQGIGEDIHGVELHQEMFIVLVNPNKACPTQNIFSEYEGTFSSLIACPDEFEDYESLIRFLNAQKNDLQRAAIKIVPEISDILKTLGNTDGCDIARLSGSGATCFGLYATRAHAQQAAQFISQKYPEYWVRDGRLTI